MNRDKKNTNTTTSLHLFEWIEIWVNEIYKSCKGQTYP